jgi:1-pyrroline-5-carboxylate dehydrogenase
MLKSKV